MDMGFSFGDAAPLAAPPLRYEALLAVIGDTGGVPDAHAHRSAPAPARPFAACLASVLLGRGDWREASLALGGSFAGGPAIAPRRKPV